MTLTRCLRHNNKIMAYCPDCRSFLSAKIKQMHSENHQH